MRHATTMFVCLWALFAGASTGLAEEPSQEINSQVLDVAPFARVVTWDPRRSDGPRAERLKEFPAEELFLDTGLLADANGCYHVPAIDSLACIGLQWLERRNLKTLGLAFMSDDDVPAAGAVRVEGWVGNTIWQGQWQALEGRLEQTPGLLFFEIDKPETGYQKVRWIIPVQENGIIVADVVADTTTPVSTSRIAVELDGRPSDEPVAIEVYNGWIMKGKVALSRMVQSFGPAQELTVRHADIDESEQAKADRTVLRFRFRDASFGVNLNDVMLRGPVYVPHAGLYVSKAPGGMSLAEYKQSIADRKTVLAEVREMPEQTREQAMARTHYNSRLDEGPIMLSLACDNGKFIADRSGSVRFIREFTADEKRDLSLSNEMVTPVFGRKRLATLAQSWGVPGVNKAAHVDSAHALDLRINEKRYPRGLGTHADGRMVIDLAGQYQQFEAEVGLQWQGGSTVGSVVFQVIVDGQTRFDSGVMREKDDPRPVSVSLEGAKTLALRITDAGDGYACDAGNWADARLIPVAAGEEPHDLTDFIKPEGHIERHLEGGWLPAPVTTCEVDGLVYRQRTYVVPLAEKNIPSASLWLNEQPACVLEFSIENPQAVPAEGNMSVLFSADPSHEAARAASISPRRAMVTRGDRLRAVVEVQEGSDARIESRDDRCTLSARLPAGGTARCFVYVPGWVLTPEQEAKLAGGPALFPRFEGYWRAIMEESLQLDLPDDWLETVIRANQVHMLLAARNEDAGRLVAPWVASDRYVVAIDSEGNSVIRGMQYFGHFEFARRASEYLFSRYQPEGYMTTGYTLMGNGWHLWSLGELMRLSDDTAWFKSVVEKPAGLCQWSIAQTKKTCRDDTSGQRVPEFGLVPPAVQADWEAFGYYFYMNSYYHAGLRATGAALERVGHPDAAIVLDAADRMRSSILDAFYRVQALAPVVPLRDGSWVPYYPSTAYTPGPMGDYFPGQDGNRSWCYDVELGAHHMVPLGVMAVDDPNVGWIMDHMEDVQFLSEGWTGYPAEMTRADWFNMGGFARVQPYYARNAEICAMRDDVKPFLRSYFNTLASLIDGEVLSIYEHFGNYCYNKTHETGYFLHQSRTMLLTERGDELWLAPLTPRAWLADGKAIRVRNAPTFFGPVNYAIESAADSGEIHADIDPPTRQAPASLVLRLRHPEGKPMRAVTINGQVHGDFDANREIVRMPASQGRLRVQVSY